MPGRLGLLERVRPWAPRPHKEVIWPGRAGVLLTPPRSEAHTQKSYRSPLPLTQNFAGCTSGPVLPGLSLTPTTEGPLPQHPHPLML